MSYLILLIELGLIIVFFALHDHQFATAAAKDFPNLWVAIQFLLFVTVVDALRRSTRLWYARRQPATLQGKANFDYGIDNIAKVVIGIGAIIYLFQFFGVDIRTLLTSISIVAAAIAIITKEYINDFLVGLYFSFSKNFEINDYVKMGEHKGKIMELQVLKLRLLNDDDDAVLIPNSKVYNTEIINYTRRDIRLMSIDFELGLNQVKSIEQLEEDLAASLADFSDYIELGSLNLRIVEMKKDYVYLKFQYTLRKFDRDAQREIRKKTVRQVFNQIADKTQLTK